MAMSIQEIYHSTWLGLARLKPVIWMSRRLGTLSSRYFSSWVRERNPSNTAQTQTAITKATKCWGKMAVYLWARKPRYSLGRGGRRPPAEDGLCHQEAGEHEKELHADGAVREEGEMHPVLPGRPP